MESEKDNKLVDITKKKQTDIGNKLVVTVGEGREQGQNRWGTETQTIRYKISCRDILYSIGNMANIL